MSLFRDGKCCTTNSDLRKLLFCGVCAVVGRRNEETELTCIKTKEAHPIRYV